MFTPSVEHCIAPRADFNPTTEIISSFKSIDGTWLAQVCQTEQKFGHDDLTIFDYFISPQFRNVPRELEVSLRGMLMGLFETEKEKFDSFLARHISLYINVSLYIPHSKCLTRAYFLRV